MTKFNLEMIDFRFTDICSFEAIEEKFECKNEIQSINPFCIAYSKKKRAIIISAYCDIEWQQLASEEGSFTMRKGQVKSLNVHASNTITGSFRLLEDARKNIFQHEWAIY